MANAKPDAKLGRLKEAIRRAREVLRPYREKRREAIRAYAGYNWSEDGAKDRQPVNLLSLYTSIVGRKLVAKHPRVMLSTFSRELKPTVAAMQDWMNKKLVKIGYQYTLQRIALDAMFSIGIGKVCILSPGQAEVGGYQRMAGEPYFAHIDLDDAVWDVNARCLEEVSFVGHRYRVPLDTVKDSKYFDAKPRKEVQAANDDPYNLEGDEKVKTLGVGTLGGEDDFEEYAELMEVYLPRHNLIVTLAEGVQDALAIKDWVGPASGPYHFLCLGEVPGNAFPKAPIMDLVDLHATVNNLYRKLDRQAARQKTVLTVQGGADEDGKRIIDANDGEVIRVDNPDRAREYTTGGINQQSLVYATHAKDLFVYLGGNLDSLGGLAPQAGTLGQDQMLEKNASSVVSDLQDRVVSYAEGVLRGLGWYWWNDPFQTMRSVYRVPGSPDIAIERQITPEQRAAGKFEDLDLDIDPYSMQPDTPQSRLNTLNQVVQGIIMPSMELLQQKGIEFDIAEYLKKVAHYTNTPDLEELVTISDLPEQKAGPEEEEGADYVSTAPASTTRRYVRESSGGSNTRGAKDSAMMQALAKSASTPPKGGPKAA